MKVLNVRKADAFKLELDNGKTLDKLKRSRRTLRADGCYMFRSYKGRFH